MAIPCIVEQLLIKKFEMLFAAASHLRYVNLSTWYFLLTSTYNLMSHRTFVAYEGHFNNFFSHFCSRNVIWLMGFDIG